MFWIFSCKLWPRLDEIVHHVVHTSMDGNHGDTQQSMLGQLPEHLHLGLQSLASYEATLNAASVGLDKKPHPNVLKKMYSGGKINTNLHVKSVDSSNVNSGGDCKGTDEEKKININRTASMRNNNSTVTNSSDIPFIDSTSTDATVVHPPQVFSPTDLTFFSNQIDGSTLTTPVLQTSNDCSKPSSHVSEESNTSPSNNCSNSISSKLSKLGVGNQTFSISSTESSKTEMNINVPESKAFAYDQKKLGEKIVDLCMSNAESNTSVGTKSVSDLKLGGSLSDSIRTKKQSNRIERLPCPRPSKPLITLKWITLDDDKIGLCNI